MGLRAYNELAGDLKPKVEPILVKKVRSLDELQKLS